MVTSAELREAALRYADLGYRVFPCVPGGKTPLTARGFHDASSDPDQIERWWTQHPMANIGLATVGLVVVDIDGPGNTWPGDADRLLELAVAPMSLTPRGGSHRLFRQPANRTYRCTTGVLATKIDTRANGGYIVVPPSVIGVSPYRWAPGLELDVTADRLPEPPEWLRTSLDDIESQRGNHNRGVAPASTGANGLTATASSTTESNLIPEGQRNATLASLAGAMRRVGMSQSEIAAALHQANQERCTPPLPHDEVDRIAASIARYAPDQTSVALAEQHYAQVMAEPPTDDGQALQDPGPIPDELLSVPGFINDVKQYILDTAPYPEPVLAFAGALSLQALLAGRKVRDAMDNRTNLYILSLANSGVGKDHARKVNAKILYHVGLSDCVGTSFASGEGIEDRLFLQPATLFQVDEIDGLLRRVGQAKDARHEQIISILLQMYTSASSVHVMRAKAGQEHGAIHQPCLCLFGSAVPKHFYESLSARLLTNGFLARLLILECRQRSQGRDDTDRPIPESLLDTARWWTNFRPGATGNLGAWQPDPRRVPQTEEAVDFFRTYRESADAEYARCEQSNDDVGMAIWARAYEKSRRLALVYACSADPKNPVITADAALWAGAFVEHQTRRMLYMARHHASEGEFDSRRRRLLETLDDWRRQHGDEWMPFWRISRKHAWTSRDHNDLRETLLQQRLIDVQAASTKGRPGLQYRLPPRASAKTPSAANRFEETVVAHGSLPVPLEHP